MRASTDSAQEKVAVLDATLYEDDVRKIECVQFRKDRYGLRLTVKEDGMVTKLGLSRIAVEQIVEGFQMILKAAPKRIKAQKFIMDDVTPEVWTQVNR